MNTYRNTVTGAIIEIPSELCGGKWVKVDSSPEPAVSSVEEEVAETPVVKKKATRKATTK